MIPKSAFHRRMVMSDMFRLNERELEIARSLARRETLAQIAFRMSVTPNAISAAIVRINRKLGLFNRFQLAAYAMENGWV